MSKRAHAIAIVLALIAPSTGVSEEVRHIETTLEEVKAVSPQCSAGTVYDDGVFTDAYSVGDGDPGDAIMVMRFNLPAGTTRLDQVCACFTRANASAPANMSFDVVVYNDNGPSGQPGTLLATVPATANSIPVFGTSQFYSVNLSGSPITVPDTSVYIGVRWPGGNVLLCGDRSATTTQRVNYVSGNQGLSWTSTQSLFPTAPPRALGIRTDPATGTGTCTPTDTAMCLNNNRFKVEATFETGSGLTGQAKVVKLTEDSGYVWFFSSTNIEVVVKVLNACVPPFNRYWVFAGGLTDVRTVLTVTDTQTGVPKVYVNPQGTPFRPIQDTSAFATCP